MAVKYTNTWETEQIQAS